ncbi:unnamed protein product [Lota lota]
MSSLTLCILLCPSNIPTTKPRRGKKKKKKNKCRLAEGIGEASEDKRRKWVEEKKESNYQSDEMRWLERTARRDELSDETRDAPSCERGEQRRLLSRAEIESDRVCPTRREIRIC